MEAVVVWHKCNSGGARVPGAELSCDWQCELQLLRRRMTGCCDLPRDWQSAAFGLCQLHDTSMVCRPDSAVLPASRRRSSQAVTSCALRLPLPAVRSCLLGCFRHDSSPLIAAFLLQAAELSYEELCAAHTEARMAAAAMEEVQTELASRVAGWRTKIAPVLEEQDARCDFDIHTCGFMSSNTTPMLPPSPKCPDSHRALRRRQLSESPYIDWQAQHACMRKTPPAG